MSETRTDRVTIMQVPFDTLTRQQFVEKIFTYFNSDSQHHVATPNPEMLLAAQEDDEFLTLLNLTNLNTPDGIGIIWAGNTLTDPLWKSLLKLIILPFKKPKKPIPERVTGVDLFLDICEKSTLTNKKIFLLGAADGIAEKTKQVLIKKYPNIQIVGTYSGSPSPYEEEKIKDLINDTNPDILFVAYGAPAQEKWIARNLRKMPTVKVAIGIGGTFDFISGLIPRAPILLQTLGLEWLYRLIKEPKRWRRIYNATVIFPWKFLKTKARN